MGSNPTPAVPRASATGACRRGCGGSRSTPRARGLSCPRCRRYAVDAARRALGRPACSLRAARGCACVRADRQGRDRCHAARERERSGLARLHGEGQALVGARVGRRRREPSHVRPPASAVPRRLLRRLGNVPPDALTGASGTSAVRMPDRRSRGSSRAARCPTGATGRSRRGNAGCRISGSSRGSRCKPPRSCGSATGVPSCRGSSSGRTGPTASDSTMSSGATPTSGNRSTASAPRPRACRRTPTAGTFTSTRSTAYGAGWRRENSFLVHRGTGTFCYGFYPHDPYPGTRRPAGVRRARASGTGRRRSAPA